MPPSTARALPMAVTFFTVTETVPSTTAPLAPVTAMPVPPAPPETVSDTSPATWPPVPVTLPAGL